jgi:hypothetical protein
MVLIAVVVLAFTAVISVVLLGNASVQEANRELQHLEDAQALHEVVNVLSALFTTLGAPHSKLHRLYAPGEEVAGDLVGMLAGFNRVDLDFDVQGYGKGSLSLVLP